jgi:MoaA/NifB/PqqE/SkfB family radical SAM enzyme
MERSGEPKVRFTWNMLYDCNYRCSFCFFEGKWKEYRKRNIYLGPDEWMVHWKRISDKYGPPYLIITGGEPFIYPNFIEIINRLSEICYHINISSNSSGDLKNFVEKIDPYKVSLSLSYQSEFDKFENFLERVRFLRKHNFDGCLNLVAYPPYLKDIECYKAKLNSLGEPLKIVPFFGEYRNISYPQGYTEEERRLIGIDETWLKKIRKKSSLCLAGQKTALIFPDGKVARCGQIGEGIILGSFFDSNLRLLDNPLPCEAEFCPCDEGEVIPDSKDNGAMKILEKKSEIGYTVQPENVRKGMYFTWDIHYKCNFRCPYCWFFNNWAQQTKRNLYLNPDEWMAHWKRISERYGEIKIEITGGEPFIYPDFIELIKRISSIHLVKVTTNLSGDIERFAKEVNPGRVDMDLNFHILFIDLDTVIKKASILKNAGFKAGICYLAYPPQMHKIKYLSKIFQDEGINFALAAFWGEYNGKKYPAAYTEEEKEMMQPFLGDISRIAYHLNAQSPQGKLCNAGYRYAIVQADGNIVRCGPLSHKSIGSILDENFRLLENPLPCEAEACPCNEYVNIISEHN